MTTAILSDHTSFATRTCLTQMKRAVSDHAPRTWLAAFGNLVATEVADTKPVNTYLAEALPRWRRDAPALCQGHDDDTVWSLSLRALTTQGQTPDQYWLDLSALVRGLEGHHATLAMVVQTFEVDELDAAILSVVDALRSDPHAQLLVNHLDGHFAGEGVTETTLAGVLLGAPSPLWSLAKSRLARLQRQGFLVCHDGRWASSQWLKDCLDHTLASEEPPSIWKPDEARFQLLEDAWLGGRTTLIEIADIEDGWLAVEWLAERLGRKLVRDVVNDPDKHRQAVLNTRWHRGILCAAADASQLPTLLRAYQGLDAVVLCKALTQIPPGVNTLRLGTLRPTEREALWRAHLDRRGLALDPGALKRLSRSSGVSHAQLASVVLEAAERGLTGHTLQNFLETEACLRSSGESSLLERVTTSLGWEDVILPEACVSGIMELVSYARYQDQVMETWGFGRKYPYGRALTALFYGAPGTGKTMAATLVAAELGKELIRVNLSEVASKWIGETEKNLARVFDEAAKTDAILLFDEADALFGKRTEVKTASDRYANMNVGFLLQKLEAFSGVVILTTNLKASIDPAFQRRIRFSIEFENPDTTAREELWQLGLPRSAPTSDSIDYARLAEAYTFSGANIKEAILRAAFLAAEKGSKIDDVILHTAAKRLMRELGFMVKDN